MIRQLFWIFLFAWMTLVAANWWEDNVRVKTAWNDDIQGVWVSKKYSMSGAHVGFVGHLDQGTAWIQVWPVLGKSPECIGIYEGIPFVQHDGETWGGL